MTLSKRYRKKKMDSRKNPESIIRATAASLSHQIPVDHFAEKAKERIKSEKIADSPSFWDRKGAISTLFLKNVPNILKYHKVLLDIITEM